MNFKHVLLLGAALISVAGLVGCSSNKEASSSKSPPSSSVAPSTSVASPAATQAAEKTAEQSPPASQKAEPQVVSEQTMYADHAVSAIPEIADGLQMDQKSYDFVVKNYKLFPAKTTEDIGAAKKMVDASISSKLINKNAAPYLDKMVSFSGVVISIEETQLDADNTLAIAHVLDEDEQSYQVMIYKSTGDILEDDSVQFWGVPIGASGFENVSGGYTNAIFVLGSHIEKIQSA